MATVTNNVGYVELMKYIIRLIYKPRKLITLTNYARRIQTLLRVKANVTATLKEIKTALLGLIDDDERIRQIQGHDNVLHQKDKDALSMIKN